MGAIATVTAAAEHDPRGPIRATLRRARDAVGSADGGSFCSVFVEPSRALAPGGIGDNRDSGGPALIEADGAGMLADLTV